MALQPDATEAIDRTQTAPFLLRLFWRKQRQYEAHEFSVAVPEDIYDDIEDGKEPRFTDYSQLLPQEIRSKSFQIYTWSNASLSEISMLIRTNLPPGVLPHPAVGTRIVYKLIFPDTRAPVGHDGRGVWKDKPLGSVVLGGLGADLDDKNSESREFLEGDAEKTLSQANFVIGDYIACAIYPPDQDGRIAPPPQDRRAPRGRENGYSGGGYGRGGGGYRSGGGYGGHSGFGSALPSGEWRRGERPPGPPSQSSYGGPRNGRGGGGRYD